MRCCFHQRSRQKHRSYYRGHCMQQYRGYNGERWAKRCNEADEAVEVEIVEKPEEIGTLGANDENESNRFSPIFQQGVVEEFVNGRGTNSRTVFGHRKNKSPRRRSLSSGSVDSPYWDFLSNTYGASIASDKVASSCNSEYMEGCDSGDS